jgi:diguanylate cyclase (GGDEF)-like protein
VQQGVIAGLSEIVRALSQARGIEEAMQMAADAALLLLPADHASVRLCDRGSELRPLARAGVGLDRPAAVFHEGEGVMGWAAKTRCVIRVGDSPLDQRFRPTPNRGFDVRSLMSVPLLTGDRVMGVFSVSAAQSDAFDQDDEDVAVVMAHCIGQAIRSAELEREAMTDWLTRAFNRNYLPGCLEAEMNRGFRESTALSVLLMDLDQFKSVNDRHGHTVGDGVLQAFVDIVRQSVRSCDVLIRRGGEEFMLVMPNTETGEGWMVAERIRTRLAEKPLRIAPGVLVPQTVSIGLATWDGRERPEDLDRRADMAMYEAKRTGRNRVVAATVKARARPKAVDAALRPAQPATTG